MYYPFEKNINDITLVDIEGLKERQIAEGLYIEYKSTFQSPLKIAHTISSFANTYGGWYFVGIESNESNIPEDLSGFNLITHQNPIEHVRNIVRDYVTPFPRYYSKLIKIKDEKAILVIEIPESDETPHITKDGRIYRRNAEGSDPVLETNRYALDRLYDKSKAFSEKIEHFCRNEIIISEAQKNQGWLETYLMPYPLERLEIKDFYKKTFVDEFLTYMNDKIEMKVKGKMLFNSNIPFNLLTASNSSIILRQTTAESLPLLSLTFQLFSTGNCKIIIPFKYSKLEEQENSDTCELLMSKLGYDNLHLYKIIEGGNTLPIFVTLLNKYFDFLKSQNWKDEFLIVNRIENIWKTILFFDSKTMSEHINNYGIPFCQRENARIPNYFTTEHMIVKMPEDCIYSLARFSLIAVEFGFLVHETPNLLRDWLEILSART